MDASTGLTLKGCSLVPHPKSTILRDHGGHSMLSFTPFASSAMAISRDSSAWQSDPEALQSAPQKAVDRPTA